MNGKSMFAVLAAVLVLVFGGMTVSTASAAGGQIDDLSNGINLPGFQFGYDTETWGNGASFRGWMTDIDRIQRSDEYVSVYGGSNPQGTVDIYYWGTVGNTVSELRSWSQFQDVVRRGTEYHASNYLNYYQEIIGWEFNDPEDPENVTPIYGDRLSQSNISVQLSDVEPTSAYSQYSEQTYLGRGAEPDVTYYNAHITWNFIPGDSWLALLGDGSAPLTMSAVVPEPATLSLLGLGLLGLLRNRRRK